MSILRRAWAKYQQLLITHSWKTQTIGTGIVIKESQCLNFFFKQKTAYEMLRSLVGSEMCIRDRKEIHKGKP